MEIENKLATNESPHTLVVKNEKDVEETSAVIHDENSHIDSSSKEQFKNNQSNECIGYRPCVDDLKFSIDQEAKKEKAQNHSNNECTYLLVCKQEHIEEIVNLKKEIEDAENAFDKKIVKYDNEKSVVIDIKDKVKDSSTINTNAIKGLDTCVSIKQEIEDPVHDLQNRIKHIDDLNKNSNTCENVKLEKHDMQKDFLAVNYGKGNEVGSVHSSDNGNIQSTKNNQIYSSEKEDIQLAKNDQIHSSDHGNVQLTKNDQIQLVTSVVFTIASRFPQDELNQNYSATENTQIEDNVADIDISCVDKKYLELDQNDSFKVTNAYLNSLSTTTEPRQKVFKICSIVQEKGTGRSLLISKYCVVRPQIIKPAQVTKLSNGKIYLHKNTQSVGKGNNKNNKSKENTYSKINCVPVMIPLGNSNETSIGKNWDVSKKSESIKDKSTVQTSVGGTGANVKGILVSYISHGKTSNNTQNLKNGKSSQKNVTDKNRSNTEGITKTSKTVKENKKIKVHTNVCHCGKSFDNRDQHLEHIRKDHWKPKEFTCEDCNQSYKKWRDYRRHKCNDKHINTAAPKCNDKQINTAAPKCNEKQINTAAPKCKDKQINNIVSKCEDKPRNIVAPKCKHCDKVFLRTKYLKRHTCIKQKYANNGFKCIGCDVNFCNKYRYRLHKAICSQICITQKTETQNLIKDKKPQRLASETITTDNFVEEDKAVGKDNVKLLSSSEDSALTNASVRNIAEVGEYVNKKKAEEDTRADCLKIDHVTETSVFDSSTIDIDTKLQNISTNSSAISSQNLKLKSGLLNRKEIADASNVCEGNEDFGKSKLVSVQGNVGENSVSNVHYIGEREISFNVGEEVIILSDTENEDLDVPESSKTFGHVIEDRLIISNSLFKKRDQQLRLRQKRKTRKEKEKVSISSKVKMYLRNKIDLRKSHSGMESKLDMKTKNINVANSVENSCKRNVSNFDEGYVMDQHIAARIKFEHSEEDKKKSLIGEISSVNNEVIVTESESDEEFNKISPKLSAKSTLAKDSVEKETDSDSEMEDDNEGYEEEIIPNKVMKINIHKDESFSLNNLDTKGKLEMDKDEISDRKLKRVSVVLNDIFKNCQKCVDVTKMEFNKQKVKWNGKGVEENAYKGNSRVDRNLSAVTCRGKRLNSVTLSGNESRRIEPGDVELSDDESDSESTSDDDIEGYEECSIEDL